MADVVKVKPSAVAQERVQEFCHPSTRYLQRAPGVYSEPAEPDSGARERLFVRLANGLCVAGVAWGASETECTSRVLSLHGWLDNCSTFERLAPLLVRELNTLAPTRKPRQRPVELQQQQQQQRRRQQHGEPPQQTQQQSHQQQQQLQQQQQQQQQQQLRGENERSEDIAEPPQGKRARTDSSDGCRVRVVCLDFPGHGHSSHRPAASAYLSAYMARDVALAVRALWGGDEDGERFSVVSHSMGAAVSATLCAMLPGRVQRAVFLDHLGHSTFRAESTLSALRSAVADELRFGGGRTLPKLYASREEAARVMCARNPHIAEASALALVSRAMQPATAPQQGYYFVHDPRLGSRSVMRFSEDEVRAILRAIQAPVLMIWAERRNYKLDWDLLAEREQCIPNFRKVRVSGGHHVHLDEPEVLLEHIVNFFRHE